MTVGSRQINYPCIVDMLSQLELKVNDYLLIVAPSRKENRMMAKTKSSVHGKQEKKIVTVNGYKKSDGTKVKSHRRSTPN